jgi:hypothetical protein
MPFHSITSVSSTAIDMQHFWKHYWWDICHAIIIHID